VRNKEVWYEGIGRPGVREREARLEKVKQINKEQWDQRSGSNKTF
jgi:hypothetical protein